MVVSLTRDFSILPSPTSSFVTFMDTISFDLVSTATCILINPFLELHLWRRIHSPLFATFTPVESTAITTSSFRWTDGSSFTLILDTLHHIVVKSGTPFSSFMCTDITLRNPSNSLYGNRYVCTVASSHIKEFG